MTHKEALQKIIEVTLDQSTANKIATEALQSESESNGIPSDKDLDFDSQYQKLFNAIADSSGTPLESEMQDIIRIVHRDFPLNSHKRMYSEEEIRFAWVNSGLDQNKFFWFLRNQNKKEQELQSLKPKTEEVDKDLLNYDLSDQPKEFKDGLVKGMVDIVIEQLMRTFYSLGFNDGFSAEVQNGVNGDKFRFYFKKLPLKEQPTSPSIEKINPNETFDDYYTNERDKFILTVAEQEWNTQMRMSCESLMIMVEQLYDRYKANNSLDELDKWVREERYHYGNDINAQELMNKLYQLKTKP